MTPPEAAPMREDVTQADRDVAEAIVSHTRGYAVRLPNDQHTAIQLAARFRLAHTARPDAGDEVERVGTWQPIASVDRVNGRRLILAWDDSPTLSYHWEVGRWSSTLGWVNTYGKAFGPGEPTHWMEPAAPSFAAAMREGLDRGMVEVPREVVAFLKGVGPLDGVWFGDPKPDGERGNFWWRKHLPNFAALSRKEG